MSIEAMKMALAKFEHLWEIGIDAEYKVELLPEIEALRQAIEQAEYDKLTVKFGERAKEYLENAKQSWDTSDMAHRSGGLSVEQAEKQEPVAWMVLTQDDKKLMLYGEEKPPIFNTPVKLIPLYTAPPKREWIGLTEDESDDIYNAHHNTYGECITSAYDLVLDIEAKLKERNT
jgi:hypothetical protein